MWTTLALQKYAVYFAHTVAVIIKRTKKGYRIFLGFYPAACIALHATRSSDEKAVCPSDCPSVKRVHCDKTEKDLSRFLYHTKDHLA